MPLFRRRSLRMLYSTITSSARSNFSGAMRPCCGYKVLKCHDRPRNAASTTLRIGRSGRFDGILSSSEP